MANFVPRVSAILPEPNEQPEAWWAYMQNETESWEHIVGEVHFLQSSCDTRASSVNAQPLGAFICNQCQGGCTFASDKALRAHMRAEHKTQTEMRYYAGGDAICQCCRTTFSSRLRLIAHISDARGPTCRQRLLCSGVVLPVEEVVRLDTSDREARRVARAAGHTQPISSKAATKINGKAVGTAQR